MFSKMIKLNSKTRKEFNTERIIDWEYWLFFLFAINYFFKALTYLEFLILTVRKSFMQYGKIFLKNFVLDKEGLIIEVDTDLKE